MQTSVPFRSAVMSNEDYHDHPALGSTNLKILAYKTFQHLDLERKQTLAMDIGSFVHDLILTPHNVEKLYAQVDGAPSRSTREGKAVFAQFQLETNKDCETAPQWQRDYLAWKYPGRTCFDKKTWDRAYEIAMAVKSNEFAMEYINKSDKEHSFFASCPETGVRIKARPDILPKNLLIDFKTSRDASTEGFSREILDRWYHFQTAHYIYVLKLHGIEVDRAGWIVVENEPPYGVNFIFMPDEMREQASLLHMKVLQRVANLVSNVSKEVYTNVWKPAAMKPWAFYQDMSIEV